MVCLVLGLYEGFWIYEMFLLERLGLGSKFNRTHGVSSIIVL